MERNLRKRRNYTLEEIAEHCYAEDLWIIIHKKVYEVTDFQFMHPGGADLLLEYGGGNATQPFLALHQHSDIAHEIMERCYIGDVWECDSQSDTSLDSTDTSPSGSSDSGDEEDEQPSREQSNDPSRSTSGAGPSSDEPSSSRNPSNSRNQSNGGLAAEILTRFSRSSVQTDECDRSERTLGNDRSALIFTFSLLAVGTIIFYRLTRS